MDRKTQLQQVARDWCLTITASQVIPVYPLTEDLQPGDVFLVQMSAEEQREHFDDKGFLPLDHHQARLTPEGYSQFYRDMFVMPLDGPPRRLTRELQRGGDGAHNWTAAPAAAFPSYGFSVSRSSGMNIGLPLYGVPVGMSLLEAEEATASVSIESARTIGVDVVSLSDQLGAWAAAREDYLFSYARNLDDQKSFWQRKPMRNYLRVVSRVYVTGGVDIAIADARSGSAGVDAGKPRPVDLLSPSAPDNMADVNENRIKNSRRAIASLNAGLAESLTPSRASGSNDNASTTEVDARTKAKQEELEVLRKKRAEELTAAEADVKTKRDAAAPAQKELDDAKKKLSAAGEALQKASEKSPQDDAKITAAQDAVDEAKSEVGAKESADTLKAVQSAIGKADAAGLAVQQLSDLVPGGSVRVTAASSRFVTLRQDFDPPLILGYLGFDREILHSKEKGVFLGPPVATQDQILEDRGPPIEPETSVLIRKSNNDKQAIKMRGAIRTWYQENEPDRLDRLNEARLRLFPETTKDGFGWWLQAASIARMRALMDEMKIPVP